MKNIFIALFILVGFGIISSIVPNQVFACSYIAQAPQEWYNSSDVVFIGEINNIESDENINGQREVTFEILKSYKGDVGVVGTKITLETGANSAMCGYDEGTLAEGDIWSIYTSDTKSFNSTPSNTKYTTFAKAETEVDSFADMSGAPINDNAGDTTEEPVFCTLQYDPVCGEYDTGVRCVTTPCPSTAQKTYGNLCQLNAEKAKFLYSGECKADWEEKNPAHTTSTAPTSVDSDNQEDVPSDGESTGFEEYPMEENTSVGFWARIWNFFKNLF